MNSSYSQFGQDIHLIHHVYKDKRDGYFIEVGAYDGIESSNTFLLEEQYGWKGIAVECSPGKYQALKQNRKCITFPYAVYNEDGKNLEFFDSGGFAGLVETNNHKHIVNDTKVIVETRKLQTILKEAGAPKWIEYLSLDTEGSEFEILNNFDFNEYTIGYICVEHNHIEINRQKIRNLLESKGYRWCKVNGDSQWGEIDDEYIHKSIDPQNITLFLNHSVKECGVYQYGLRVFKALEVNKIKSYLYAEVSNQQEYNELLKLIENNIQGKFKIRTIIYNYHHLTMTWVTRDIFNPFYKHVGIPHESEHGFFDSYLSVDPTEVNGIPRPLYFNSEDILSTWKPSSSTIAEFINYKKENTPCIGSFGFCFTNKGFHKIINLVNSQYDNAIIKLVIPLAAFDSSSDISKTNVTNLCNSIPRKAGIELLITHEFFTNEDILGFLRSNTINIFAYDMMERRSISSVIDYALSIDVPIGISNSAMFRHMFHDSICIYYNTIEDIKNNTHVYVQELKKRYSIDAIQKKFLLAEG